MGSPEKSQSYQASIPCWAIIGPPAKRHLNGVSLAGRWWPAYSGTWILSYQKKVSLLDTLWQNSRPAHVVKALGIIEITHISLEYWKTKFLDGWALQRIQYIIQYRCYSNSAVSHLGLHCLVWRRAWCSSKLFDTLMVFLKEFFLKKDFENNLQTTKTCKNKQ